MYRIAGLCKGTQLRFSYFTKSACPLFRALAVSFIQYIFCSACLDSLSALVHAGIACLAFLTYDWQLHAGIACLAFLACDWPFSDWCLFKGVHCKLCCDWLFIKHMPDWSTKLSNIYTPYYLVIIA